MWNSSTMCSRLLKYCQVVRQLPNICFQYRIQSPLTCMGTAIRRDIWTGLTVHTNHMNKVFPRLGNPALEQLKATTCIYQPNSVQLMSVRSKSISERAKRRKLLLLISAGYCGGLIREEFYNIDYSAIVQYIGMIKTIKKKFVYISPELIVFIHKHLGADKLNRSKSNRILAEDLILRQTLIVQCLECEPWFPQQYKKYLPLHPVYTNNVGEFLQKIELLLQEGISRHEIRKNMDILRFSKRNLMKRIEKLKGFRVVEMNCCNLKKSHVEFMEQRYTGFDILMNTKGIDDALDSDIYEQLARDIGIKFSDTFVTRVQLLMRLRFSLAEISEADCSVFDPTIKYILPLAIEHLRMQNVSGNLISRANSSTLQDAIKMRRRPYKRKRKYYITESHSIVIPETWSDNMESTLTILNDLGFSKEEIKTCLPLAHQSAEHILEGYENFLKNDKITMSIRRDGTKLINALNYEIENVKRKKSCDDKYRKVDHDKDEDEDDSYIEEIQIVLSDEESAIS